MPKHTRRAAAAAAVAALVALAACADDGEDASAGTGSDAGSVPTASATPTAAAATFPLTVQNCNEDVVFPKRPEKVLTTSSDAVEYMAAAGAADRIIGRTGESGQGLRDAAEEAGDVPVLSEAGLGLEATIGTGADLTFGYGILDMTRADLAEAGIASLIPSFNCGSDGSGNVGTKIEDLGAIESIYADLELLGNIFGTADAAAQSIDRIKSGIEEATEGFSGEFETAIALIFYGSDIYAFEGTGAVQEMMDLVGLENLFTGEQSFDPISLESIIELNPDVIILSRTIEGTDVQSAEQTIEAFKDFPGVTDMDAVANDRFVTILPFETDPNPSIDQALQSMVDQLKALQG